MIKLENMTIKETTEMVGGTEQLLQEMLEKFRGWLQQQNHLPQGLHLKIQISRTVTRSYKTY